MIIHNREQLIDNLNDGNILKARKIVIETLEKAIYSVQPQRLVKKHVKFDGNLLHINGDIFNLDLFDKVYVIGAGKA
ncbi:MAG: DUF4147 domain-containing protein, partial [Conexivisphaerales archaeon]